MKGSGGKKGKSGLMGRSSWRVSMGRKEGGGGRGTSTSTSTALGVSPRPGIDVWLVLVLAPVLVPVLTVGSTE
jgi:hypothetical protein